SGRKKKSASAAPSLSRAPTCAPRPAGLAAQEACERGEEGGRTTRRRPRPARPALRVFCAQEKRRLQEAIGAAHRELEEEKLRVERLKRKSLRERWLMDGAAEGPERPEGSFLKDPLPSCSCCKAHLQVPSTSPQAGPPGADRVTILSPCPSWRQVLLATLI
ncbi:hypothetical protein MC885_000919, partial [Smutsia gigantea]